MDVGSVELKATLNLKDLPQQVEAAQKAIAGKEANLKLGVTGAAETASAVKGVDQGFQSAQKSAAGFFAAANQFVAAQRDAALFASGVQAIGQELQRAAAQTNAFKNQAVSAFAEYDKATTALKTLPGTNVDELKTKFAGLSGELKNQFSQAELLSGGYDVLSAGFTKTSDAIAVSRAGALAARGGFTDFGTSVNGLAAVLNAYGEKSEQAGKYADQFVAIQNAGKIRVSEFVGQLGRIAPTAAAANISVASLGGVLATLTNSGVQASEAVTSTTAVISSLAKPNAEAIQLASTLGISLGESALKSKGLIGVLGEIKGAGDLSLTTLTTLANGNLEAAKALLPLIQNLDQLKTNTDAVTNSQGAAAKAAEIVANSYDGKLKEAANQVKDALIPVGEGAAKVAGLFLSAIIPAIEAFNKLPAPAKEAAGAAIAVTAAVLGAGAALAGVLVAIPFAISGYTALAGAVGRLSAAQAANAATALADAAALKAAGVAAATSGSAAAAGGAATAGGTVAGVGGAAVAGGVAAEGAIVAGGAAATAGTAAAGAGIAGVEAAAVAGTVAVGGFGATLAAAGAAALVAAPFIAATVLAIGGIGIAAAVLAHDDNITKFKDSTVADLAKIREEAQKTKQHLEDVKPPKPGEDPNKAQSGNIFNKVGDFAVENVNKISPFKFKRLSDDAADRSVTDAGDASVASNQLLTQAQSIAQAYKTGGGKSQAYSTAEVEATRKALDNLSSGADKAIAGLDRKALGADRFEAEKAGLEDTKKQAEEAKAALDKYVPSVKSAGDASGKAGDATKGLGEKLLFAKEDLKKLQADDQLRDATFANQKQDATTAIKITQKTFGTDEDRDITQKTNTAERSVIGEQITSTEASLVKVRELKKLGGEVAVQATQQEAQLVTKLSGLKSSAAEKEISERKLAAQITIDLSDRAFKKQEANINRQAAASKLTSAGGSVETSRIDETQTNATIALKQKELAETQKLRSQGVLGAKEAADKEISINAALDGERVKLLNLRRQRELADVEQRNKLAAAAIDRQANAARLVSAPGAVESSQIDERSSVATIAQKQKELVEVNQLEARKVLGVREAEDKKLAILQAADGERVKLLNLRRQRELADVEQQNKLATAAIDRSTSAQTLAARQTQLSGGGLTGEGGQAEIQRIQEAATQQTIAQKEKELAQVNDLEARKVIGVREAEEKKLAILQAIDGERAKALDQQTQRELRAIQNVADAQKRELTAANAGIDQQKASNDLLVGSLQRESQIVEAQAKVASAVSEARQQQLKAAVDRASEAVDDFKKLQSKDLGANQRQVLQAQVGQIAGGVNPNDAIALVRNKQAAEAEADREKLAALQQQQAAERKTEELKLRQAEITARNNVLEAQRANISARIAENEQKATLLKALKTGDANEIANAQQGLDLASQNVAITGAQIGNAQANAGTQQQVGQLGLQALGIKQGTDQNSLLEQNAAAGRGRARELAETADAQKVNIGIDPTGGFGAIGSNVSNNVGQTNNAGQSFGGGGNFAQAIAPSSFPTNPTQLAAQQGLGGGLQQLSSTLSSAIDKLGERLANSMSRPNVTAITANPVADVSKLMADSSKAQVAQAGL